MGGKDIHAAYCCSSGREITSMEIAKAADWPPEKFVSGRLVIPGTPYLLNIKQKPFCVIHFIYFV
jgi:hypothetical protein